MWLKLTGITPKKMSDLLKVFVDADVLFAASASPQEYSASSLVLLMSEIELIDAVTSQQAIAEAERNLRKKMPRALPAFHYFVARSLDITPNPTTTELRHYLTLADTKDLPILVAAIREECHWLVTFNLRHFQPGHPDIRVVRPGTFVRRVREQLGYMQ